jgi:ribosomal-protein-serine acetyltransferase
MYDDLLPVDLGEGITLGLTKVADAEEAFAVVDRERDRLREWLPWVDATTTVAIEREFLLGIELANADGTGLHTTIRIDGGFAGFVGLRVFPLRRCAEVGYWLAGSAVGRGVMVRAVAGLVDLAVGPLDMHRVELLAATGNERSRAVAERLGFAKEGVRREAEELASGFVDLVMYAVLAREWPGSATALVGAAESRS